MSAEFAALSLAIKQIVRDYLDNENLSNVAYATYTGAGLKIDGKPVEVPASMVDIPLHLQTITGKLSCDLTEGFEIKAKDSTGKEITVESIKLTDVPVTIKTGLAAGSRVAVVQQQGAQRYSVIDEVGT